MGFEPCYVALPNADIRLLPPELEPFVYATMVPLLAKAMLDLTVADIAASRSKSGEAIKSHIGDLRKKKNRRPVSDDCIDDKPIDPAIQSALFKQRGKLYQHFESNYFKFIGRAKYMGEREERKRKRPATVVTEWSRRGLVKAMKLDRHGRNLARLDGALDRLVEIGVLASWKVLPNGRLRIAVNGSALPTKRFTQIALPFPTQSKVALALYLFIHWIDLTKHRQIKWKRLCKLLGLPARRDNAVQALERAVNYINDHLEHKVDWVALAQVKKGNIKTPKAINFEWLDDGASVRFFAAVEEHVEEPRKMKPQKQPTTPAPRIRIVARDEELPPPMTGEWRAERRKQREEREEYERQAKPAREAMRQQFEAELQRSIYSPMNAYREE
jgi:hypothetical protein